ncbi:ABC transporter ATP-binding protein [Actinomadura scrupuli]|uniref:ABC transporter ATP-binding protein n=1 Tax=Actinomadura scrupuli TaxID=559629 RepID=UPI003D9942AA
MIEPQPLDPAGDPADSEAGAAVSIAGLTRAFPHGGGIEDFDLDLVPGSVTALVGPSGSGKSTLVRLLGGLERPDAGVILVGGETVSALPGRALPAYRRRIGIVFEQGALLPDLSVLDNVVAPALIAPTPAPLAYGTAAPPGLGPLARMRVPVRSALVSLLVPIVHTQATLDRRRAAQERGRELLAWAGLAGREDDRADRLSPADRQRVAVARALIGRPALLLADEPAGALGSAEGTALIQLLLRVRDEEGLTVLIATHDPELAIHCDRVVRLRDGRVADDSDALP